MDLGDVFRRFLGFPNNSRIPSNWEDWGNRRRRSEPDGDEDYCDDDSCLNHQDEGDNNDIFFSFGVPHGRGGLDGMFEHFHGNMQREMEAIHRQMEEVMTGFGAIDFPAAFNPPRGLPSSRHEFDDSEDQPGERKDNSFTWFNTPSPFFDNNQQKQHPSDFMLKAGVDHNPKETVQPSVRKEPKIGPIYTPVDNTRPHKNMDTDLDGKLNDEQILSLVKPSQEPPTQRSHPVFSSSGSSMTFTTVRGADGRVEKKKVVRNSSGHEEITVTRSLGDQSHTLTTITKDGGQQEKHETFNNMDESNIGDFDKKWSNQRSSQQPRHPGDVLVSPSPMPEVDQRDQDIFSRLFNWRDK